MAEMVSDTVEGEKKGHSTPTQVVERFLELLRRGDVDGAVELLAVDVVYENVGLPTVYGRERVRRVFRATLGRSKSGFDVYMHAIAEGSSEGGSEGSSTVLTERTDVLKVRGLHVQLWVCGRFDVEDGQIVLWRDYFDQMTSLAATARGLLGLVVPAVRAKPPAADRGPVAPRS
jgi:limonene-1,2-epoxide hydrolase